MFKVTRQQQFNDNATKIRKYYSKMRKESCPVVKSMIQDEIRKLQDKNNKLRG